MRPLIQLNLTGILLFMVCTSLNAQIPIGGYNVYYGHLHNHTSYSDGQGTPEQAYASALSYGLDFFGLAEHSNSLDDTEWSATQTVADTYNNPGVFTTFRGFEWTTTAWGHVAVIHTPTRIRTDNASYDTFPELVTWLNTQSSDCFAFFNHPGEYNGSNSEFSHFDNSLVTDKIVGMEQWNKTDQFPVYYASFAGVMINGYFSGDGVSFYDEALQRGWRIAPEGSEDNHVATWGNMTEYKTAVLANANTRADLIAAFQARRFYTTADENTAMSFKINGSEMGSNVLPGTWIFHIRLSDGSNETFSKVELMKNGVVSATWTPGTSNVDISQEMSFLNGEYYYVRVYQAGSLTAFSAPIWITTGTVNVYPSVNITSPATASVYTSPAIVTLAASASDSDGTISKVEFFQGTTKVGEDTSAPYSYPWNNVTAGYYTITAKATDNLGAVSTSSPVYIAVHDPILPNTVSSVIAAGTDDAEQSATGSVNTTSTDMELVNDSGTGAGDQTVGLRFTNLMIPQGAQITGAYIQFTCDETTNVNPCSLTIRGEAVANSAAFTTTSGSISARTKTSASVSWSPADWTVANAAGTIQQTPQIVGIVQEIVNLPSFSPASPVTLIITGTGRRTAWSKDGTGTPAKLVLEFTLQQPVAPQLFEKRIILGSDDAEEYNSGTMLLNSDDIDLVYDSKTTGNQKVGLRFQGVTIPKNSLISSAFIRFTADEVKTGTTTLLIQGLNADNATTFTTTKKNISSRAKTVSSVPWAPSGWSTIGASGDLQKTPDLKAIVQEIVNRTGWASNNSMAFIITGTGTRTAVAFETNPAASALLLVEYFNPATKSAALGEILRLEEKQPEGKLTCYPVPVTGELKILFEPGENENTSKIKIFNAMGGILRVMETSENIHTIDMDGYPEGIYFIGVQTNRNHYVKTVIKH